MKNIAENVWVIDRDFRLAGADFGNRMTIIRLADNHLWLHSPISIDSDVIAQVKTLGEVEWLITPNCWHTLFVNQWLNTFPHAHCWVPRCTFKKMPNYVNQKVLDDEEMYPWSNDIETLFVEGTPKIHEFVFLHKLSRTLILTDLAFNISSPVSWWTKTFFRLNDSYNKFGPTKVLRLSIKDREAFNASISKILDWDFDRIIISHGQLIETGGKEIMRKAFL